MKVSVLYDGEYWIDSLIKVAEWSGDTGEPYRTLTLTLSNTLNGEDQAVRIELGKEIRFYVDGTGLFRGVIFTYDINARGEATVTAYDENVYLRKNSDTRKFIGRTAAQIVRELCASYSIPVGTISDTGYVIPRLVYREVTLWEMIVKALAETRKQTGRKFRLFTTNGKVNLAEKKDAIVRWVLEDGVNILDASRMRTIGDTRTSVKVLGGDEDKNPISATVRDSTLAAKYGVMQHVERADTDLTQSQLTQLANQRLIDLAKVGEEVTVEALGMTDVVAGAAVYAFEGMTEVAGGYYVTSDRHTFEAGVHRMSVMLSRTDDLPDVGLDDAIEEIKTAKKKAVKKTQSVTDVESAALARLSAKGET